MNKEQFSDENVVEYLHKARMEQWIGDFEKAEKIYRDILNSSNKIVAYLESSINKKIKKLSKDRNNSEYGFVANYIPDSTTNVVEAYPSKRNLKFGSLKKSLPLLNEEKICISQKIELIWKYSIIANSRSGNNIRFEIRGYPQTKQKPELINIDNLSNETTAFSFKVEFVTIEKQMPDLARIDVELGDSKILCSVEIDSWGTICGEAVVLYERLNLFFESLSEFLSKVEKTIWK